MGRQLQVTIMQYVERIKPFAGLCDSMLSQLDQGRLSFSARRSPSLEVTNSGYGAGTLDN